NKLRKVTFFIPPSSFHIVYPHVDMVPDYLSNTTGKVSTDNFYWTSRLIAAMADASFKQSRNLIERYQNKVAAKAHEIIHKTDALLAQEETEERKKEIRTQANQAIADMAKEAADESLSKVLFELSSIMKNAYARSDA
ncbi:MAG: C69 family dipeptidase, partial [Faecalicoccus sp.]|uniref:C69 family dipeptidase n=1 Tax=Faecalicoccus sp. TaxID=1971758 RepID=UPI002F95A170